MEPASRRPVEEGLKENLINDDHAKLRSGKMQHNVLCGILKDGLDEHLRIDESNGPGKQCGFAVCELEPYGAPMRSYE